MADTNNSSSSTPTIASLNASNNIAPTHPKWGEVNETLAAQIAEKIKANSLNGETDDLTSFETKKKVDNVKQKIYVFVLAVIAYLCFSYASWALDTYQESEATVNKIQLDIDAVEGEITSLKSNEESLKMITRESDLNNLINCINNSNLCDKVIVWVKKNIQVTRSYLLVTPLSWSKMDIDQKTLLKYFNEYLLVWQSWLPLGQLLNITFTSPSLIEEGRQIYTIWVDSTITFTSKDAMMEMIAKVETWLNPDNPLLIKISSLNYDIVKFEEPQTVNISFLIYNYK